MSSTTAASNTTAPTQLLLAPCGSPAPASGERPSDRSAALATLRRLREIGVNFIDTAASYGPNVSEQLIERI